MNDAAAADSDIGGLFAAIDAQDSDAFVAYLTEDAVFRFGSAPPVQGRSSIRAAVDGFFGTIAGCAHRIDRTLRDSDTLVCVGEVTYRKHDGGTITLPFTNVLDFDGGLITVYGIYIDIAPLYAD